MKVFLFDIAITICMSEGSVFNQETLAVTLSKLSNEARIPPPMLRTVIQALDLYPGLSAFVTDLMMKLLKKKVWNETTLWHEFKKLVENCWPQSVRVLVAMGKNRARDCVESMREKVEAFVEGGSGGRVRFLKTLLE